MDQSTDRRSLPAPIRLRSNQVQYPTMSPVNDLALAGLPELPSSYLPSSPHLTSAHLRRRLCRTESLKPNSVPKSELCDSKTNHQLILSMSSPPSSVLQSSSSVRLSNSFTDAGNRCQRPNVTGKCLSLSLSHLPIYLRTSSPTYLCNLNLDHLLTDHQLT